jgi:hypothetical protein
MGQFVFDVGEVRGRQLQRSRDLNLWLLVKYRRNSLRVGRSRVRILVRARNFHFSITIQTGPVAHVASSTVGTMARYREQSGRGLTMNTHPYLASRLRMSRAEPPRPLCAARHVTTRPYFYRLEQILTFKDVIIQHNALFQCFRLAVRSSCCARCSDETNALCL